MKKNLILISWVIVVGLIIILFLLWYFTRHTNEGKKSISDPHEISISYDKPGGTPGEVFFIVKPEGVLEDLGSFLESTSEEMPGANRVYVHRWKAKQPWAVSIYQIRANELEEANMLIENTTPSKYRIDEQLNIYPVKN